MNTIEILNSRASRALHHVIKLREPKRMMELLGNPQDTISSIVVAGTNGKGSVCSALAAMLMSSGKRVAQFTSPHLHHFTERLLIQGRPVEEKKLLSAIDKVISKEAELGAELSYFELIIAGSFQVCNEERLDWIIVEVGLGGLLDATNVIESPRATVITSIGLDHTEILGHTQSSIARHKAGIFRKNTPAFVGVVSEEAKSSILEYANEVGTSVDFLERTPTTDPLIPQYKANNINLTRRVASALGISNASIERGFSIVKWPGRLEEVPVATDHGEQLIVLDGAHNPDGIDGLIDYLDRRTEKAFVFLVSILSTKDHKTMISKLEKFARDKNVTFLFCKMTYEGGVNPELLSSQIKGSISFDSCEAGLEELKNRLRNDTLGVITGSLYFIGEARGHLVTTPFTTIID